MFVRGYSRATVWSVLRLPPQDNLRRLRRSSSGSPRRAASFGKHGQPDTDRHDAQAPTAITVDNGGEFVSRATDAWSTRTTSGSSSFDPANPSTTRSSKASMVGFAMNVSMSIASDPRSTHNACSTPGATITITSARVALCKIARPLRWAQSGSTHVCPVSPLQLGKIEPQPKSQVASRLFRPTEFAGRVNVQECRVRRAAHRRNTP